MVVKREAELKSHIMKALRAAGFLILEYATPGAPDRSLIHNGHQSNWEFKHGMPASQGLQELTCMRLAAAGHCRYVIWYESRGVQRTLIVHPQHVHDRSLTAEASCVGFDIEWLVKQMWAAHV